MMRWWYAITRHLDRQMLWKACRDEALSRGHDLDFARGAFAVHAFNDPGWLVLGEAEMLRQIGELK